MGAIRDIETIVTHGLCAGCGLCESLAGRDTVEMAITSFGQIRPKVKAPVDEATMEQVRAVCPGVRVTGPEPKQVQPGGTMHPVWGPVRTLHRGWASDDAVRYRAATGGVLTALGAFLLESGKVEAILHVRASMTEPVLTDGLVSTTAEQVVSGAQSRYGPSAPLTHVHRLLDEGRRFAVIGKPCDIAAIRNLATIDPRVDQQIPYCLTIFCGGVPTVHTARKIARYHGVEENEVGVFRWRGGGWPGPTHVENKDGRGYDMSYDATWFDESVPWTYDLQFRCKICLDAIGELADVACPDGWILKDGQPVHGEAPGVNLLVARTERGERLVAEAAAAGVIELAPCELSELDAMHADHLPRKLEGPARIAAIRSAGQPAPRFARFRLWQTVPRAGLLRNLRAFIGAWRRIRAGANREPLT